MQTEILRIIEGGLANDKRKIIAYSSRLADRLEKEGDISLPRERFCERIVLQSVGVGYATPCQ